MRSMRLAITSYCCVAAASTLLIFNVSAAKGQAIASAKPPTLSANRTVTLDPLSSEEAPARSMVELTQTLQHPLENFRQFDAVSKGQIGDTKTLTLRFAASAKLLTIKSTPEFKVEQGGSCVEGFSYTSNSTCTLLVRSTPQGTGHRLGKLEITNSVDAKPLNVGLGGYGYSPTISFTPSIISTVPGTYPGSKGLLSGATNLAVDGGDSLYMADTGNNLIRYMDSSGTIQTITFGYPTQDPVGIAVDGSGTVYFAQDTPAIVQTVDFFGDFNYYTAGTTNCAFGSTCGLQGSLMNINGAMATDPSGNVFLGSYRAVAKLVENSFGVNYVSLFDPYSFNFTQYGSPQPLAVDANDSIYAYANASGSCSISLETYYQASNETFGSTAVAGGRTCGFAGDGGQARGAEIGTSLGQMAFDIAGNFYFSDTSNQRVRRIDATTGIITTIAGNGSVGYGGDNGPATSASLNTPTGVAVDSQGQVYILSNSATTGSAQVVRKVGVVGALNLGSLAVGTASTAQTVQLANTGNSQLDFTHVGFSSGNTSDFVIDPNTTSCNFTVPLYAGRSCKIGFIFTPSATGARSAVLSITDDTIAGVNTIQLSGTGYTTATLTPASFSYTSTVVGSSSAAQKATLTNTGKAAMTITSIAISGSGATSYSETTTCGTTLAVGASCTVSVVFKPTAAGTLAATLTVSDNALGGHQSVTLTGAGVASAAKAALSPTSLSFPSQAIGTTSAAQTIKLSNPGTVALGVTSATLTGPSASNYVLSNGCGTSVAAGGSCTLGVSFKPLTAGTRTATVSVVTSVGTVTASLTGAAVAAAKVKLVSAANPARMGLALLTAQVSGGSGGTVQIWEGQRLLAHATAPKDGTITLHVQGMSTGMHLLHAVYVDDTSDRAASSGILKQMIMPFTSVVPVIAQSE